MQAPRIRVEIMGFTDRHECAASECDDLSFRRAKSVYDWLLSRGLSSSKLKGPTGNGSEWPIDRSGTEDGWQYNRRVQFDYVAPQISEEDGASMDDELFPVELPSVATSDDQQVISAVVNRLCDQKGAGYYFLSSSSATVAPYFTPEGVDESARRSLLDRNNNSEPLPVVDVCDGLKRMDQKEIDSYLETRGKGSLPERWMAFYEKFPDAKGVMYLSLPGYSTQGDIAVVQVSGVCGWLCGGGSFWILQRVSGHWQVDKNKTVQGWTS